MQPLVTMSLALYFGRCRSEKGWVIGYCHRRCAKRSTDLVPGLLLVMLHHRIGILNWIPWKWFCGVFVVHTNIHKNVVVFKSLQWSKKPRHALSSRRKVDLDLTCPGCASLLHTCDLHVYYKIFPLQNEDFFSWKCWLFPLSNFHFKKIRLFFNLQNDIFFSLPFFFLFFRMSTISPP